MRHIKALICVLLAVIPALIHAQLSEEEPAKKSSRKLTFGIRGDKDLDLYNKVATNAPPFNGADYPDFSSTLSLIYSHDGSTFRDSHATGVLIDPYWVLTVGHNFYDLNSDSTSAPPEGITVQTGSDAQQPKKVYTVDKVVLHPTWQEGQQDDMTSNDICLLKLKEPITEIVPTPIMTKKTELLNATVWLAGFGDYNRKGSDYRPMRPKRHAIENRLDRKVSITLTTQTGTDFDTGLLVTDFDPPSGDLNSLSGDNLYDDYLNILGEGSSDAQPTEYEGTSVPGDSGGPLYIKDEGEWKVCGVLSATQAMDFEESLFDSKLHFSYGAITFYTRVASHSQWIQETISENQ